MASVASVVKFCGLRKPERESGQPKLINSERGMGAHGTRGGTAKRARNASAYGWSRLGRSLALPAGRRSRAGLGAWALFGQAGYFWPRTNHGWNLCSSVSFSSPTPRPACSDIRLARVCGLETTPQAHWKLIGILHFRFFGAASRLSPICRLV